MVSSDDGPSSLGVSLVGHRENATMPLREEVRALYRIVLEDTGRLPQILPRAAKDPLRIDGDPAGRPGIQRDAHRVCHQAEGRELANLRGWASKAAGRVARIPAVLHVVVHACHKGNLGGLLQSVHVPSLGRRGQSRVGGIYFCPFCPRL